MAGFDELLQRNKAFAATDARANMTMRPATAAFLISCIDPRVEPAAVLGVGLGDAVVLRNAGGRVTDAVIADVAFISFMVEKAAGDGPLFEVAVLHHTQCGTGALADPDFRRGFAERTGFDEAILAAEAVTDPATTVRADVARLLRSPLVSPRISVSGHLYDLDSGLVTTIVEPISAAAAAQGRSA